MAEQATHSPVQWRALLIGAGGGFVSFAMFYSAVHSASGLSLLLLPLMPLPSLIAGLGWGTSGAVGAAIASFACLLLVAGPKFALGFAISLGLPVLLVSYLASLVRYDADDRVRDWYPAGRIVMAIALYGAALPVLIVSLDGGSYSVVIPEVTRFFQQFSNQAPADSSWHGLDANQLRALVDLWVEMMPAILACYWTLFFTINTYLAGRAVLVSGHLVRPWPNLNWLSFSPLFAAALGLSLVGVAVGGSFSVLGIGAMGAFSIAFFLQGLSVVHAVANARGAIWMISVVYAALLIAGAVFMPMIALLGVIDTLVRLRGRIIPVPPALPLGSV